MQTRQRTQAVIPPTIQSAILEYFTCAESRELAANWLLQLCVPSNPADWDDAWNHLLSIVPKYSITHVLIVCIAARVHDKYPSITRKNTITDTILQVLTKHLNDALCVTHRDFILDTVLTFIRREDEVIEEYKLLNPGQRTVGLYFARLSSARFINILAYF